MAILVKKHQRESPRNYQSLSLVLVLFFRQRAQTFNLAKWRKCLEKLFTFKLANVVIKLDPSFGKSSPMSMESCPMGNMRENQNYKLKELRWETFVQILKLLGFSLTQGKVWMTVAVFRAYQRDQKVYWPLYWRTFFDGTTILGRHNMKL